MSLLREQVGLLSPFFGTSETSVMVSDQTNYMLTAKNLWANYTFIAGYNTVNSNFKLCLGSNNLTTFTLSLGSYQIQVPPNTASISESGSSIDRYWAGVPATLKTNNTYLINFENFNSNVVLVMG